MRFLSLIAALLLSFPVMAAEQVPVDQGKVLRGSFVEEKELKGLDPLRFKGNFVISPNHGLIWKVEKPFPTSFVVTKTSALQDIGGITMQLKIRKLAQIYDIVGRALTGDWHSLQPDFAITRTNEPQSWKIVLKPRPNSTAKIPYASITVTGNRFVESIVLTKADGIDDSFTFSNAELSQLPLNAQESALFAKIEK